MDIHKKVLLGAVALTITILLLLGFIYIIISDDTFEPGGSKINKEPLNIDITGNIRSGDITPELTKETDETKTPPATLTIRETISPFDEVETAEILDTLPDGQVAYRVWYNASWSKETHPDWFPLGAHLSPMVAWTQVRKNTIFTIGKKASAGMEEMAETGAPIALTEELDRLRKDKLLVDYAIGSLINAPGSDEVVITASQAASIVSVVSMVAPSPDWFITAHNIPLYENGEWKDFIEVHATLYDAGTDEGKKFRSLNKDSEDVIKLYRSDLPPIASFYFIRVK